MSKQYIYRMLSKSTFPCKQFLQINSHIASAIMSCNTVLCSKLSVFTILKYHLTSIIVFYSGTESKFKIFQKGNFGKHVSAEIIFSIFTIIQTLTT